MTIEQVRFAELAKTFTLKPEDRDWLDATFVRFGNGFPTLQQLWLLVDEVWREFGCDPRRIDERFAAFYAHPIWLLNGLFIENDVLSMSLRRDFSNWVAGRSPTRIADFGGGFGTLARMIGATCPRAKVEIIEPHPNPAAIALAAATVNVTYEDELTGKYDILIATDVFEHVSDPLGLVAATARFLKPGGHYLIANCFLPVVQCHLPQHFHFQHSWNVALASMGLVPGETVSYGQAFTRCSVLNLNRARAIEKRSRLLFPWIEVLPKRWGQHLVRILWNRVR